MLHLVIRDSLKSKISAKILEKSQVSSLKRGRNFLKAEVKVKQDGPAAFKFHR